MFKLLASTKLAAAAMVLVGLRHFGMSRFLIIFLPTIACLCLLLAAFFTLYKPSAFTSCGRALRFAFALSVIGLSLQER